MLSLNLSFRRMVIKYIPQLNSKDLDKYESLTAFRHQISEDIRTLPKDTTRESARENSTIELNETIKKGKNSNLRNYKRVQELYIAKRKYALQQGNYQQIPSSPSAFWRFLEASINYRYVQIKTLPRLWLNQLLYFITNFWAQISASLIILTTIISTFNINHPPEIISTPDTSETINSEYNYQVVATDPNLEDTLNFFLTTNPDFLMINPVTGLVQGKTDTADTGVHIVRIIVTDNSMFDLQEYKLTIAP